LDSNSGQRRSQLSILITVSALHFLDLWSLHLFENVLLFESGTEERCLLLVCGRQDTKFLESAATQWTKEKARIPTARNVGGGRKNKWTTDEDHTLECAVAQFGEDSWRKVAIVVRRKVTKDHIETFCQRRREALRRRNHDFLTFDGFMDANAAPGGHSQSVG
jgi:uncharacterized protein YpbB